MTRRARGRAGGLLEGPWSSQVEGLAKFYGWLGYHTHDSRRSAAGFPDWVFVRDAELLFVELKTDTGRVRPEQRAWLEALEVVTQAVTTAGGLLDQRRAELPGYPASPTVEVHIWRPRDFEAVHDRLARGRLKQTPIG